MESAPRRSGWRIRISTLRARALAALASTLLAFVFVSGPSLAAECEGDDCQSPPAAPAEVIPGTAGVQGPSNPPAQFPEEGKSNVNKPKQHGKHHKPRRHHRGDRH